jgi:(1->4)-alpha-D-glucan 1-alpha-D-glucosylmutase
LNSPPARIPRGTYRLQFQRAFDLRQGRDLVGYLAALGISDCYSSPILESRPASPHGYDICDHGRVDDELGGEPAFESFVAELSCHDMGLILDFVPNHMAADPRYNHWWRDVLENGPRSRFARYFDVDWHPVKPELRSKVLLPVLGDLYGFVLERGELELAIENRSPVVRYFDQSFPIDPASAERIKAGGSLAEAVRSLNGRSGDPASFDRLHDLLERQAYRLSYWKAAFHEINYRRFFDINDLVGLRMEEPEVFEATHHLVLRWIRDGKVTGLRLDHIDGLFDPAGYLARLREATGPIHILVEKILSAGEELPERWPVQGTTGYDFLNDVNGLFVDPGGARVLQLFYGRFTRRRIPFPIETYVAKKLITATSMASELNVLALAINRISETDRRWRDFTLDSLRDALREVVASFPVYRTYLNADDASAADVAAVNTALVRSRQRVPGMDGAIFDFLRGALLPLRDGVLADAEIRDRLGFAMKFQQYTGPVQAKGLEDTAFYRHNVLISLNEVGGDPRRLGRSVAEFHEANRRRLGHWPHAMLATTTHDTKRGEDARARIDALSEMARDWRIAVSRWSDCNEPNRTALGSELAPSRNDEYLFYQSLLGVWPPEDPRTPSSELVERVVEFMLKAAKEAKLHTSWTSDNRAYDDALGAFVERSLTGATAERFLATFRPFAARVATIGMVNSLAQLVLKLCAPGVPDFYQGTELWDLSLVDPDNRRPVDFAARHRILDSLAPHLDGAAPTAQLRPLAAELLAKWPDGRIKMWITACGLRLRARRTETFSAGEYHPIDASGDRAAHLVAFARAYGGEDVIAIAPRLPVKLTSAEHPLPLGERSWGNTRVLFPRGDVAFAGYRNVLTGETVGAENGAITVAEVLSTLPVALLERVG